jgi:hypothetical protein
MADYEKYGIDPWRDGGQTMALFGGSFSGKSTLLCYYLNNIAKAKAFDVIIVFTQSINAKPLERLEKSIIKCLGYHDDVVKLAYKINMKTENRYRFLFVLDDVVDVKQNKTLQKQLLIYRNSNISTIVSTQYCKLLTGPSTRGSLHSIIFTGSRNYEDTEMTWKTFLRGHMKGYTHDGADEYIRENTILQPTGGKVIRLDNIRNEMVTMKRPKLK